MDDVAVYWEREQMQWMLIIELCKLVIVTESGIIVWLQWIWWWSWWRWWIVRHQLPCSWCSWTYSACCWYSILCYCYYYFAAFNAPCVGHKDDESQALSSLFMHFTITIIVFIQTDNIWWPLPVLHNVHTYGIHTHTQTKEKVHQYCNTFC